LNPGKTVGDILVQLQASRRQVMVDSSNLWAWDRFTKYCNRVNGQQPRPADLLKLRGELGDRTTLTIPEINQLSFAEFLDCALPPEPSLTVGQVRLAFSDVLARVDELLRSAPAAGAEPAKAAESLMRPLAVLGRLLKYLDIQNYVCLEMSHSGPAQSYARKLL